MARMQAARSAGITQVDFNELIFRLCQCATVSDVLDALFPFAQRLGLTALRYYRWVNTLEGVISIDCVGHGPGLRGRLRGGRIVHDQGRADDPLSFRVFDTGAPVAFVYEPMHGGENEFQPGAE